MLLIGLQLRTCSSASSLPIEILCVTWYTILARQGRGIGRGLDVDTMQLPVCFGVIFPLELGSKPHNPRRRAMVRDRNRATNLETGAISRPLLPPRREDSHELASFDRN